MGRIFSHTVGRTKGKNDVPEVEKAVYKGSSSLPCCRNALGGSRTALQARDTACLSSEKWILFSRDSQGP